MDPTTKPLHILVVGGQSDSLTILRGSLIQSMIARGHRVSTAAGQPLPRVLHTLTSWGATYHEIPMDRAGLNPLKDMGTLLAMVRVMRGLRPDVVLAYQAKPLNYAMIAAVIAGVPRRVGLVTGLGYAFTGGSEGRRRLAGFVARNLYRLALRFADGVVFQNEDDRELFQRLGLLRPKTRIMRAFGSGVDLDYFAPVPAPGGPANFLMIARVLRDKGVYEFVDAARLVKRQEPKATFTLVGPFDPNPAAIGQVEVQAWVDEGLLTYAGAMDDVRPAIAAARVVVLPSYREGVPRTLLEAMAMGRPIVTTDVPGCRDAVVDGDNGYLVPARRVEPLAAAMVRLARDPNLCAGLGARGRQRACTLFDAKAVSQTVISFVESV